MTSLNLSFLICKVEHMIGHSFPESLEGLCKVMTRTVHWSSRRGSGETNLTSIHEDTGLIPGLVQCIKDLVLLRAVV